MTPLEILFWLFMGGVINEVVRSRHDIVMWWKYKRHSPKSFTDVQVPEEPYDAEFQRWTGIKGGDPEIIIVLNGVEVV